MSDTFELAGIAVTRYVGPASLLDRRRIALTIRDGTMRATPQGPEAIRDLSFSEARALVEALEHALEAGS